MELLPKSHKQFSEVNYWDTFFKSRGKKSFEWYGEYPELCSYLFKYIKVKDKVLVVGCGNSNISMELYDVGYKSITNIDISPVVIKQMKTLNKNSRPGLIYEHMDATQLSYADDSFNVVLDKGTLDALMTDENEKTIFTINKYIMEIKRVLSNGGRYICISLLQEHILKKIITDLPLAGFMIRIIRCHEAEIKAKEKDESSLPVFIVVATKFNKLIQPIFETALIDSQNVTRVNSKEEVFSNIASVQESALIFNGLQKGSVADIGEISIDLSQQNTIHQRFTIFVVDREINWLFSTKEGRLQLLMNTEYDRLAVVILRREHTFENLETVQKELSSSIRNFAPANLNNQDIPFLTLKNDVGKRMICYEGKSEMSGSFVIEEVEDEGYIYRRIFFSDNFFVTQSESRFKLVKSRRGKLKKVIDYGYLCCSHHVYMSIAIGIAVQNKESSNVLLIGLGGGALCSFLHESFSKLKITAVEIDSEMLKVATEYFGLIIDERVEVVIIDGLKYLEKAVSSKTKFDAIMFDVDNKDVSVGMSCPPKQFLETQVLSWVAECLEYNGIFILNLVVRNKSLRPEIIVTLKQIFKFVVSYPLEQQVNEIILCSKQEYSGEDWKNVSEKAVNLLNQQVQTKKLLDTEISDVSTFVTALKIE